MPFGGVLQVTKVKVFYFAFLHINIYANKESMIGPHIHPTVYPHVLSLQPSNRSVQISRDGSLESGDSAFITSQNTPSWPAYKHHWFYCPKVQFLPSSSFFLIRSSFFVTSPQKHNANQPSGALPHLFFGLFILLRTLFFHPWFLTLCA